MISVDWNCFSWCSLLFAISIHTFSDFYWESLLFWLFVSAIHFDSASVIYIGWNCFEGCLSLQNVCAFPTILFEDQTFIEFPFKIEWFCKFLILLNFGWTFN
jgi:hypothetical protein